MVSSFSILVLLVVAAALIIRPFRSSGALLELIRFSELWQWHGTVDRKNYVLVGVVGLAIKHNMDRIVATAVFGRRFTPWNYWIPPVDAIRINSLSPADSRFLATMAIIALPFIWIGLAMTVRRLRSTGLPLWLVLFFFIPIGNLVFFLVLSLIPARAWSGEIDVGQVGAGHIDIAEDLAAGGVEGGAPEHGARYVNPVERERRREDLDVARGPEEACPF